jgi:hypothetical protein
MANRPKPFVTAVIGIALIVLLITGIVTGLKKYFAPMVTRDNAGMVLRVFGDAVQKGNTTIHDPQTAVSIANGAFRDLTNAPPIDGWGKVMRVTATLDGPKCTLTVQSPGPDGLFDTDDDILTQQTFNLSKNARQ